MSELLSSITGGGGGLPQLAPDLTWPSAILSTTGYAKITGINAVGSLVTALNLTGKHSVSLLNFTDMNANTMTVKLTVDGVVIFNDSFTCSTQLKLLGSISSLDGVNAEIQVSSSLLLEVQMSADASIDLNYVARPIL